MMENELAASEKDSDCLVELHYGHRCFESDDSYTSDESGSFDENLKPSFYTLGKINQNINILKESPEPENIKASNGGSSSEIAKLFAECITPTYCFICEKQGGEHYMASRHYIKVQGWLQNKLESMMTEPNLKLFFCEICNKALSGDESAQNHYESVVHKNNSVNFCLPCLHPVPNINMASHVNSKKHKLDSQNTTKSLSRIKDQFKSVSNMLSNINNTNNIQDLDTSLTKTETKIEVAEDLTIHMKDKAGKNYVALANNIMDALGPSFCYICGCKVTGSHYNLHKHHKALEQWILGYMKMYGINVRHMEGLICFVCHAVFPNIEYAKIHYNSSNHKSKIRQFCNICLKKLIGKNIKNHYETPEHKTEEVKRQKMHDSCETNSHIKNVLSAIEEQPTRSNLDIHGIDLQIIKALIEDNTDIKTQCEPLIVSLLELMTPAYCFICNNSAFKNNKGLFKHYLYMGHRTKLKLLFHLKGRFFSLQNYESLYCETCNELFLNFKFAEQHYLTSRHKWNYNLYQKYGKSLYLHQNEFKTNRTTLDDIIKGCSTLGAQDEIASSVDKEQSSESEINHRSTWFKQLAYLVTLDECKICSVKLETIETASFHYSSENHYLQIRKLISCYKRDDYSYVNDENQQMFGCCFCDNRFITEQLLNNHTSSHFPPLEGATSNISHKMSNIEQQSSLDNTDVDKLVQKETEKKDEDKDFNSWNSAIESKTSSALQESIDENQDWEQIENQCFFVDSQEYLNQNKEKIESFCIQRLDNKPFSICDEHRDHESHFNKCDDNWKSDGSSDGTTSQMLKLRDLIYEKQDWEQIENQSFVDSQEYFNQNKEKFESTQTTQELDIKPLSTCDEHRQQENKVNTCNDDWESDGSSDGYTDQNSSLSEEIRIEMTKLINEVYFLRTVPLEESLKSLKELNQKLRDARDTYKKAEIQDDDINYDVINKPFIKRKFLNNFNDSDYAKFKLSMEIHRLKMVLGNEMKIPSDVALSYIHNLRKTLESGTFDINSIFDSNKTSSLLLESLNFEEELEKLDDILLKAQMTNVQVTLNIITQFNVQLETMLEYQQSSSAEIDDY